MPPSTQCPTSSPSHAHVVGAATLRVGYQGIPGAFGEEAVQARFGDEATPVGLPTFAAVLGHLLEARLDLAVVPVHNSSIGRIAAAQTALRAQHGRVRTVDELELPVRHCLVVLPGVRLGHVQVVGSHPAALAQCRVWAAKLEFALREVADTATAAQDLTRPPRPEGGLPAPWHSAAGFDVRHCGAIASGRAARRYGLRVLAENVQDELDNCTRFIVVAAM